MKKIFLPGTWTPFQSCLWILRSFSSNRVWCVETVAGICVILPELGVVHSCLRPSEFSLEASLSLGNAKFLRGCPIHINNSNTSNIPDRDPTTVALLSEDHHRYKSHACCNHVHSADVYIFVRFFHVVSLSDWNGWLLVSIMQQNRL